jgi:hypothetical protein
MKINVYSQELTGVVLAVRKKSNAGLVYSAVQFILHSSPLLHHPPQAPSPFGCPSLRSVGRRSPVRWMPLPSWFGPQSQNRGLYDKEPK